MGYMACGGHIESGPGRLTPYMGLNGLREMHMVWPRLTLLLLLAGGMALLAQKPAQAHSGYCPASTADDSLHPLPASLVPRAESLFGLHNMSALQVQQTTVVRCMAGHLWACNYGANLPCNKANSSRAPSPGVAAWCRDHHDAGYIPAYITGHDAIYDWRCHGGTPAITGPPAPIDARGFLTAYWRMLE